VRATVFTAVMLIIPPIGGILLFMVWGSRIVVVQVIGSQLDMTPEQITVHSKTVDRAARVSVPVPDFSRHRGPE
jgi:hypothetical protein